MDVFAEQLEIVRGLWSADGPLRFEGRHYRADPVDAQPKPSARRGSSSAGRPGRAAPRSPRRFADEYNTVSRRRRSAAGAARSSAGLERGRPLGPRFSVMTGAVLGRDRAEVDERARAIGERTGQPGFTPPDGWITGTPEEAAEELRALAEAGVDRVMLQLLLHEDVAQIELIGRELAPALSGR